MLSFPFRPWNELQPGSLTFVKARRTWREKVRYGLGSYALPARSRPMSDERLWPLGKRDKNEADPPAILRHSGGVQRDPALPARFFMTGDSKPAAVWRAAALRRGGPRLALRSRCQRRTNRTFRCREEIERLESILSLFQNRLGNQPPQSWPDALRAVARSGCAVAICTRLARKNQWRI